MLNVGSLGERGIGLLSSLPSSIQCVSFGAWNLEDFFLVEAKRSSSVSWEYSYIMRHDDPLNNFEK
jgi:hypothetical protein